MTNLLNKKNLVDDIVSGITAMMKMKAVGILEDINEYELGLTMILATVTTRLEMGKDEANIAVQQCKYALGFSVNDMPPYLQNGQDARKND